MEWKRHNVNSEREIVHVLSVLSVIMQGKCLIFNQSSKSCNTSFSLFFLEGPEDADFQEEDQEDEFPNFQASTESRDKAPLQPTDLSQQITDNTDTAAQSAQSSSEIGANIPADNTDTASKSAQSSSEIGANIPADNADNADTASLSAQKDFEQSQHLLDLPVKCDVAPLQPQAPLQPSTQENIRDPLIGGTGKANLSFELSGQEASELRISQDFQPSVCPDDDDDNLFNLAICPEGNKGNLH